MQRFCLSIAGIASVGVAIALAGCDSRGDMPILAGDGGSELETAAIERGVVIDAKTSDPVGLYARDHAAGSDGLCLTQSAGGYRFGAVISFGSDLFCEGTGEARRNGETISLRFDGAADCRFDATYEGDAIALAGSVPDACAALCTARGTFAGAAMRRTAWDKSSAERLKSRKTPGTQLCGT